MFYVYVYLDPRKPGIYNFDPYQFDFKPFYIGKGSGNRYKVLYNRNKWFKNICKAINNVGFEPIVVKLYWNIDELMTFKEEERLIKLIGRRDLGRGPLLNFTDGGFSGIAGRIISKETKQKQSTSLKKKYKNSNLAAVHSKTMKRKYKNGTIKHPWIGKKHSLKTKEKMSNSNRNKIFTYKLTSPTGETYTVTSLRNFCLKNGLTQSNMCNHINYPTKFKHCNGWKGVKIVNYPFSKDK